MATKVGLFTLQELDTDFVDTGRGILTPGGLQFSTTSQDLQGWAGSVFEHVPLRQMLAEVSAWQGTAVTLVLWLVPALLLAGLDWWIVLPLFGLVVVLRAVLPAMINRPFLKLFRCLELPVLQGIYYIVSLSLIGRSGATLSLFAALALFFVLRTGILNPVFDRMAGWLTARLYHLAPVDVSLRSLIISTAALYGIKLEGHEKFGNRGRLFSWIG